MPRLDKFRRGLAVVGPATFAGSVSMTGPFPINATMTFSSAPTFNVPPRFASGSAAYQISGITRIGSGLVTATVSTTAINSGGMVHISTNMVGIINAASSTALGILAVTTVAQAASGGYFTVGFTGVGFLNIPLDVNWFIINPA